MKHFKQFKLTLITLIFLLTTALATVQAKPPTFESLVKKANTQYNAGKYDEAINTYNQAYQMKNMAAILYNLGRSYEAKADFNTAIKYYSQFAQSPDIEYDARVEALDRIKTLQEVQNLATSPKPKSTNTPKSSTTPSPTGCVDPNTATLEQLQTLPSIGEATAKNIIESRNTQGPFNSPQDLTRVKRIGDKTVQKILPQLCPFKNNASQPTQTPPKSTTPTAENNAPQPKTTKTPEPPKMTKTTGCIDPNTATLEQLQTLPTIGEATAKNIIESRNTQGPFNSPQDLTRVKRIGEKTVEKILPQLCPFNNNNPKTPQPPKTPTNPTPKKESAVKNPPKNTPNTGDQWNL